MLVDTQAFNDKPPASCTVFHTTILPGYRSEHLHASCWGNSLRDHKAICGVHEYELAGKKMPKAVQPKQGCISQVQTYTHYHSAIQVYLKTLEYRQWTGIGTC